MGCSSFWLPRFDSLIQTSSVFNVLGCISRGRMFESGRDKISNVWFSNFISEEMGMCNIKF